MCSLCFNSLKATLSSTSPIEISSIELERCDVLLRYYDEKIKEELKNYKK